MCNVVHIPLIKKTRHKAGFEEVSSGFEPL